MTKTKWWVLLSALLFAAPLGAQPRPCSRDCSDEPARRVWRDADLRGPLPQLQRQIEPEALAGLKRRAELPTPPSGYRGAAAGGYSLGAPAADTVPRHRPLPPPSWQEPPGMLYAEQPLYPYLLIIQSGRPLWQYRDRPPATVPPRRGGGGR